MDTDSNSNETCSLPEEEEENGMLVEVYEEVIVDSSSLNLADDTASSSEALIKSFSSSNQIVASSLNDEKLKKQPKIIITREHQQEQPESEEDEIDVEEYADKVDEQDEDEEEEEQHNSSESNQRKVVNVINSTKIIIKGVNNNASEKVKKRHSTAAIACVSKQENPEEEIEKDNSIKTDDVLHEENDHKYNKIPAADDNIKEIDQSNTTTVCTSSKVAADVDADVLSEKDFNDKLSETGECKQSTPKIKREIKQLQKMMNDSKILTEYINDSETRVRKVKKMAKHEDAVDGADTESITSKASTRDRSRSRSCSRNHSPMDMSAYHHNSARDSEKGKRNMRSQNAEFSAKHQKFLRGIQSQQDSDASENSENDSTIDDKSKQKFIVEKPKQIHLAPKLTNQPYKLLTS